MSIRTEKLASVIKKDIGEILQRNYQPSGTFITVTQVRMTEDLSIAKIYLSVFSPGRDEGPIYRHIDDNQTEIRYLLASKIKNQVRRIPELLFFQDDTSEYVNRIEKIFSQVKPESSEDDNDENKSPSANKND
jgi:ribosome-binding factor A